jgi:putative tryptophan/tyrosine transport system substrate-binding protein
MRRRDFIRIVPGITVAWPFAALARQSNSMRRIGVLMGFPEGDPHGQAYVLAMRQRLESLGWVESRNIPIDYRWAGGDPEKARAFELIGMTPSVIVTSTNQVTEIVRREIQSVPIVFASLFGGLKVFQ